MGPLFEVNEMKRKISLRIIFYGSGRGSSSQLARTTGRRRRYTE